MGCASGYPFIAEELGRHGCDIGTGRIVVLLSAAGQLFRQECRHGQLMESCQETQTARRDGRVGAVRWASFYCNTGTAFALASGTVGAALAGALAGVRSISLSYGHFANLPPALEKARQSNVGGLDAKEESQSISKLAHHAACRIVKRLSSNWEPNVGVYAVNLPLGWTLREPTAVYTTMWDSVYGQLYQPLKAQPTAQSDLPSTSSSAHTPSHAPAPASKVHFSPVMTSLLNPPLEALPEGTDIWALMNGLISVTRLSPRFMEPTLVAEAASNSSTLKPVDESLRIGTRWRL
ncbi:Predicted tubulin-tyrosine ligase [Ceraceosorus bombacis]|uniref:Predicted tubulin-tyrosine ligase n=1 Tax=Ceraceosorus bombacis TaxID=401625 RepID=A0A0P1BBB1_9BASI|nr:Predicted tubulin-tyrosine ligase [Ceraceosorus bombacis]